MTLDEISEFMRSKRKAQKITLAGMARKTGFTDSAIGLFEHGGNPRLETLITYAEVLGMEVVVREKEGVNR